MITDKVTRVEVIDHTRPVEDGGGRVYAYWTDTPEDRKVSYSLQDNDRTLKIFIEKK
jgi:hypothetical protein